MPQTTCNPPVQFVDKNLVAKRFACARNTYGQEARVQQQVAKKMAHLLIKHISSPTRTHNTAESQQRFRHITEFGCGTGYYSRLLFRLFRPEFLLLNDLCPEMEECVRDMPAASVHFLPGDAETLDFQSGTDLITSCSTLQWFACPQRFFARCHHFLSDGGILAFSTFGKKNMQEIRALTGHGLEYPSLENLKAMLSPHFDIIHAEEEIVTLHFDIPLEVLHHLKQTGVTGTEKRIWTRGYLQHFCNEYLRLFGNDNGEVPLSYHPMFVIAKKSKNIKGYRLHNFQEKH